MYMSRWSDASPDIVTRPPSNFEAFFASLGASLAHARPLAAVLPNDERRSSPHIPPTFFDSVLSCFKESTTTSLQSRLSLPLSSREPRSLDPSYGRKLMLPMMLARREECPELDEMSGKEPLTWRPNGRHGLSSRPDSTPTTAFVEPKDFFSASSASQGGDGAHHLPASDSTPDVIDPHDEPLIEPFPPRRPLVHRRHRSDHGPRHDLRRTVLKRRLTAPSSLSAPLRTMEGHLLGPSPRRVPSAERLTRLPPPPTPLTDSGRAALELAEPDPEPAPSTPLAAVHFVQPEEPQCSTSSTSSTSSSPSANTVDGERSRFSDSDSNSDSDSDLDYDSDDDCDEDEGAEAQEEEGEEDDDSKDAKDVQWPDGRSSPSTTSVSPDLVL
ncbi:hypothetical protein JCM1840_006051 [Sporobolomyces johnsonii]